MTKSALNRLLETREGTSAMPGVAGRDGTFRECHQAPAQLGPKRGSSRDQERLMQETNRTIDLRREDCAGWGPPGKAGSMASGTQSNRQRNLPTSRSRKLTARKHQVPFLDMDQVLQTRAFVVMQR